MTEFIPFDSLDYEFYTNTEPSEIFPDFDIPVDQVSFYLPGRDAESALRRGEVQNIEFNGDLLRTEWVDHDGVDGVLVTVIGTSEDVVDDAEDDV